MKHVVKFSGGAASAVVAKIVIDEQGHDDVILLYCDTKSEHPDADRFRLQVCDYLRHEMTVVSDGRDIWQLIDDEHCLPSHFIPFCTRILKAEPSDKFLKSINEEFIEYLGFTMDEIRRVQRAYARAASEGKHIAFSLLERGISSDECKRIIREEWRICLPEPYKFLKHNNCIPCFKGGKRYWIEVAKHYPEQFEMACKKEEKIGFPVFHDMTLRELKELSVQQMQLFSDADTTPCMCAV
jgi:hypothetical protein